MKRPYYPKTPKGADGLTDRQREVLEFVVAAYCATGLPPTLREVRLHFRFSSPVAVMSHYRPLARKGKIRAGRHGGSHRFIPTGYVVVAQAELSRLRELARLAQETQP